MHFISEFSVFRFVVNNILVFKTDTLLLSLVKVLDSEIRAACAGFY
jgi:hypothetical protein